MLQSDTDDFLANPLRMTSDDNHSENSHGNVSEVNLDTPFHVSSLQ
jgi:hypothetical protein